jgi:hypothetical protein
MSQLRLVPIGGCSLTIPLLKLHRRRIATSVFLDIGFRQWPLSVSPNGALQLVRLARGTHTIPSDIFEICYNASPPSLPPDPDVILSGADVVLIEMSTPVEFYCNGFFLNPNRLRSFLIARFKPSGAPALMAAALWQTALQKRNEGLRAKRAAEILDIMERDGIEDDLLRKIIVETRGLLLQEEEMYLCLRSIRDILARPTGIVLYNFRYMPDGRPVEWPAGFKGQMESVALRLDVATYDPTPLVQKHGVNIAVKENSGHYAPPFCEIIGAEYMKFISTILER